MTAKKVFAFAGRKILKLFLLIAAVEVITFALMEASPIDPVTAYVGASTSIGAEQRELIAEKWGLNKPPLERFASWFQNILHGDWGDSMIYRRPVMQVVGQKFASSLVLMAVAWVFSGLLGFFLGIAAGMRENSTADRLISAYCHILISTPAFWLGIFLIIVFSVGGTRNINLRNFARSYFCWIFIAIILIGIMFAAGGTALVAEYFRTFMQQI